MSTGKQALLCAAFAGIVLGNLLVAGSRMFHAFAPISVGTPVLIGAGFGAGLYLGWVIDDKSKSLGAVLAAVTLAMILYFCAVVAATWLTGLEGFLDVVILVALLQAVGLSLLLLLFGAVGVLGTLVVAGLWTER